MGTFGSIKNVIFWKMAPLNLLQEIPQIGEPGKLRSMGLQELHATEQLHFLKKKKKVFLVDDDRAHTFQIIFYKEGYHYRDFLRESGEPMYFLARAAPEF